MNAESSNSKGGRIRGCVSISDLFQCIDFLWLSYTESMQNHPIVKEVGLEDVYQYQTYSNIWSSFDCLYWLNAESSNCKGGRIRWCVSISDLFQCIDFLCLYCMNALSTNCKGGRIRGCVSISDLFQCIDFLWLSILHECRIIQF